jgi:hypothetical protein
MHFGHPKYPRAFVCVARRTRKWSRVRLRLGLAPAGRRIFGEDQILKKLIVVSDLHEIYSRKLRSAIYSSHFTQGSAQSGAKGAETKPEQQ